MTRRAAATLFAIAVAGLWATEAGAVRILGRGAETCSAWLRARTTPQAGEYREWFLGYLSASAFHKNRDILRTMSAEQVLSRVGAECQRTPDKRIDEVLDGFLR